MAVFSLMLVVTWISMTTLHSVNAGMATLVESNDVKTASTYRMRDLIRLRSATAEALAHELDTAQREELLTRIDARTASYLEARGALGALAIRPRERAVLQDIDAAEQRIADAYRDIGDIVHAQITVPERLAVALNGLQLQEHVLLNHLNELVKLERTLANEALEANRSTYRRTQQILIVIVACALALSLLIGGVVAHRVSRANERIAHLANHDDLTGLLNRRSFEEHLGHTLAIAERNGASYGLLYFDLDRFKIVNDTCGHHAGDELLRNLTGLVSGRLRRGDLFARVGGDEFAIIAQAQDFAAICQLAEDLRAIVAGYTFTYAEQDFKVSLSIGVVPLQGDVSDVTDILTDVDSACYVAKRSGRNRVHVTSEDDAEVVKYRDDIAGVQSIRRALNEERLTLFFQPVYALDNEPMVMDHCEILLRVRSENGELYSPARFIPIAEKYDVMSEIDRWVFARVIDWLVVHQDELRVPRLLVNLSGLSFIDDDFNDFIIEQIDRHGVDPTRIAFEITETAAVDNFDRARDFIARVRELGCQLALDDFGSGFSTFAYLKRLPIDFLKIDGSLVGGMADDEVDREMVRAINSIGHTVGARTIAEFVEDDRTLSMLREMGVDYAQGYGLRVPAPLEELAAELSPVGRRDAGFGDESCLPLRKAG